MQTKLLLLLLLAVVVLGAAPQPCRAGADEDSVKALEVRRGEALMRGDTTAIGQMTAPEFIEISRLGTLRTRADNLRDVASGVLKLTSVHFDSTTVSIYGNVAILRAIADNTGTMRGFPFSGRIWITRIFVRRNGKWQAVAMQHTMIP